MKKIKCSFCEERAIGTVKEYPVCSNFLCLDEANRRDGLWWLWVEGPIKAMANSFLEPFRQIVRVFGPKPLEEGEVNMGMGIHLKPFKDAPKTPDEFNLTCLQGGCHHRRRW